jgi:hypothetical protein
MSHRSLTVIAGAMENWGLITFRMTALLYDAMHSTAGDKERVCDDDDDVVVVAGVCFVEMMNLFTLIFVCRSVR